MTPRPNYALGDPSPLNYEWANRWLAWGTSDKWERLGEEDAQHFEDVIGVLGSSTTDPAERSSIHVQLKVAEDAIATFGVCTIDDSGYDKQQGGVLFGHAFARAVDNYCVGWNAYTDGEPRHTTGPGRFKIKTYEYGEDQVIETRYPDGHRTMQLVDVEQGEIAFQQFLAEQEAKHTTK